MGRKMPRYHLFGSTVTIANQMETNGVPGHVAITQATLDAMPTGPIAYTITPLNQLTIPNRAATVAGYLIAGPVREHFSEQAAAVLKTDDFDHGSIEEKLQIQLDVAKRPRSAPGDTTLTGFDQLE